MSEFYSKYEVLAIAYLTGQATTEELNEYRRLYSSDAGFREIVDDVETWLAPLNDAISNQPPPPGLLDAIMQDIEQDTETQPSPRPLEEIPSPANDTFPSPANDNPARNWRTLAIASSIIANFG